MEQERSTKQEPQHLARSKQRGTLSGARRRERAGGKAHGKRGVESGERSFCRGKQPAAEQSASASEKGECSPSRRRSARVKSENQHPSKPNPKQKKATTTKGLRRGSPELGALGAWAWERGAPARGEAGRR
jgi:hypothetical protein